MGSSTRSCLGPRPCLPPLKIPTLHTFVSDDVNRRCTHVHTFVLVQSNIISGRSYLPSSIPPILHETRSFVDGNYIVFWDPRGGAFVFGLVDPHSSEGMWMRQPMEIWDPSTLGMDKPGCMLRALVIVQERIFPAPSQRLIT